MARKEIIGTVIKNKMNKTITVAVEQKMSHKKYKKILFQTKKFYVHGENKLYQIGDQIKIRQTRPISKTKCWIVVSKIHKLTK
uniref:Small ribosomal subunit protein uS17c n=1 Tax=Neogoniolithon spectabile TaxID=231755 RepID=A0A3G3MGR2_9FLOR|nr:ribosomal protein S17 [Neogoniolithon spectabile]AYR06028.1 ribosomal protein S17 [Neogoniolithon spectabile]